MSDPTGDDWGFDFERSSATAEGSNVANHMLYELMTALGIPVVEGYDSPEEVWEGMLNRVRLLDERGPR